jgi:hypothetical protein
MRFFKRIPKTPHTPGDRLVPMAHCGCTTCLDARRAAEDRAIDRHGEIVGNLLGLEPDADVRKPSRP